MLTISGAKLVWLPTTRDIYERTVHLCGESGRNCQVRLGGRAILAGGQSVPRLECRIRAVRCARCAAGKPLAALASAELQTMRRGMYATHSTRRLLDGHRGQIILLRPGELKKKACPCYEIVRRHIDRLVPYSNERSNGDGR
jgi:hypothetical protein